MPICFVLDVINLPLLFTRFWVPTLSSQAFDVWGTLELLNDEQFLLLFSHAGENELLHQPGPFRLTHKSAAVIS